VQLRRRAGEIRAHRAEVTLIGQASPRHAAQFRRRMKIERPVLADAERVSYKAAGARRTGVTGCSGPR